MTDIVWDEIVAIEYIDPQDPDEMVYDFSVEDVETFTTKEGIVIHNTLNTLI
jgi:DNA-directed RNA polymerase subunit A"